MKPLIVLTTVGENFDARVLATSLVENRLAACVNIVVGIASIYRWKERIAAEHEQLLVIKTTDDRLAALREALLSRHPYEVPELAVIEIDSLEGPYRQWLFDSVS